jgi:hypothetical protein
LDSHPFCCAEQAFAWYKANMEQKKDEKRYMFVMIRPKGGAAAEEGR